MRNNLVFRLVLGLVLFLAGCSDVLEKHICDIEEQIDFRVIGDVVGTWSSMEPEGTSKYGTSFDDNGHLLEKHSYGCGTGLYPLVVGDYNSVIGGFSQPLGYIKLESVDIGERKVELRYYLNDQGKEEYETFLVEIVSDDRMRIKYPEESQPILLYRVSKNWSEH